MKTKTLALFFCAALSAPAWAGVIVEPAAPRKGEIALLTFGGVEVPPGARIEFEGAFYPLWTDSDGVSRGLVVVDRDLEPGPHRVALRSSENEEGRELLAESLIVADRRFPEQRLKVDEKMVTLSRADLERVERERKIIGAALAALTPEKRWRSPFSMPLAGEVSSPFGLRRFYNGKPGSYHAGVDLAAPRGAEVRAVSEGRVLLTGDFFYTGNTVFVDHGLGLVTGYFHMDAVLVKEGQEIGPDTVVGRVGSTGRSTGAHLHWSVSLCAKKADPESLVRITAPAAGGGENP